MKDDKNLSVCLCLIYPILIWPLLFLPLLWLWRFSDLSIKDLLFWIENEIYFLCEWLYFVCVKNVGIIIGRVKHNPGQQDIPCLGSLAPILIILTGRSHTNCSIRQRWSKSPAANPPHQLGFLHAGQNAAIADSLYFNLVNSTDNI